MKKNPHPSKVSAKHSRTARNLRRLRQQLKRRSSDASAELKYQVLEPKLPLDASFFYNGDDAVLSFDNFTAGESVFVTLNNDNNLVATLDNGVWAGGFAEEAEGNVAGNLLTVEGDFGDFFIRGLADGSTVTFGGNANLDGVEVDISSDTDFTVLQNGSGQNQSGFNVAELRITGGNTRINDRQSVIENLILNDVNSFEYFTDNPINSEFIGSAQDGYVILSTRAGTGAGLTLDSVNIPGSLYLDIDGDVSRNINDNGVVVDHLLLDVEGNVSIENLRAAEISGDVEGNYTITDSDNFGNATDTRIVSTPLTRFDDSQISFFGLSVDGNLDWTIRGSSLAQDFDAPLRTSTLFRVFDNPFDDSDSDAGTALFQLETGSGAETLLLADSMYNDFGSINVVYLDAEDHGYTTSSNVPRRLFYNAIEFSDIDSLVVGNINTSFVPVDLGRNQQNRFNSRVKLSTGRGLFAETDFPVLRGNTIGSLTITGQIESEELLLQAPGMFSNGGADIDASRLFLGGDTEIEGRANFQIDADSLETLSVNLFDGFSVITDQELSITSGVYSGSSGEVFTTAFADEYGNVTSTRLDFDVPFSSRKLVADVATDIAQANGAVLTIDELVIEAKRTVLDNIDNDFQRIAKVGDGFADEFAAGDQARNNDEDVLVIRDVGTLEIASLSNQPIDAVLTSFSTTPAIETINGIQIDGTVDIVTGYGGDVVNPRTGGPSAEQVGPTGRIERFTVPRGRTDGVFRDDNYNGATRPVYFIEFIYDGVSPLTIQSGEFERRDPERVRGPLDVELGLYNENGDLLAVDDDDSQNQFDVLSLADVDPAFLSNGVLPAGRYYVAASAFSAEFEDGFVVETANNRVGTLNVTIANGANVVAPEVDRDLTQQPTAPLIVTGGEDAGDLEEGEPDGSVVLAALADGEILLAETDLNDIRQLTVNQAVGVEYADADDAVVISNDLDGFDFARLSVGRAAMGGVLTLGDFSADEVLIQADTGVVTNGDLDIRRLLIGGTDARDSGGNIALISPNTEELAFQFVNENTDFALATNQDLVIGTFESRDGVLIEGSIGDEIRLQANSLTINSTLEAQTKLVVEVNGTLTAATPAGIPGIVSPQLYFVGAALDLSQSDNPIDQIAVQTTDGDFQLQSSITTNVASLDNQIDVGALPTSETLNFNPTNTLTGVDSSNNIEFNVLRLTQDEGAVLRGEILTIVTTGGEGNTDGGENTVDQPGSINNTVLPTGPEVDRGTTIDNDVATSIAGSFEATVGDGNAVTSSAVSYLEIDDDLVTRDLIFAYATYVRVGATTTNLASTTITQAATLIAEDLVESRGTFDGPNGLVTWIARSRFDDGIATFHTTLDLEAAAGTSLGDIQVISYLDEDIEGVGDDFLTTTGIPGQADFRAFTLDGVNRIGFSHGGFYENDGTNQVNATYAGWAADQFSQLQSAIQGSTQDFTINGTIDLADLSVLDDPEFLPAFGPEDVTTAFAWNTVASATSSRISSFLELLPTVESTDVSEPTEPVTDAGDIILTQSNSVSRLVIPSANTVSFTNDRQLVVPSVIATSDVSLESQAGDVVVDVITSPASVTLTAADDIRDNSPLDGNRISATTLNLTAGNNVDESPQFNGILVHTNVDTINAAVNSNVSGDLIIRELTGVTLDQVVVGNGKSDVVANGTITATDFSYTTQNPGNTITFIAAGDQSDILIDRLSSGGAADIRLIAGDDVVHAPEPSGVVPTTSFVVPDIVDPANRLGNFESGSVISIETSASTGDPELTLFNSSGVLLAQNNDRNAVVSPDAQLAPTRLADGAYVIAVSGFDSTAGDDFMVVGGDTAGAFNLNINGTAGPGGNISGLMSNGTLAPNQVIFYSFTVGEQDQTVPQRTTEEIVIAEDLFVLADNKTADGGSGINLNTNVVSARVQVGRGPDQNPNAGAITINETGALRLDYAKTRLGAVNVTTGGNLVANFVQAEGINDGDAITLVANGTGSDVVTNEIRVRQATGRVSITAADDIRDVNSADDKLIVAKSVALTAGNNLTDTFDGIIAQTRTNLISAKITSDTRASMFLFNRNALRVEDTFVTNGSIGIINNGGNLQAIDVRSGGQANSRVLLRTLGTGSDIVVSKVEAADRGEIFLDSADDIFDSVFADEQFVTAEFLSATARNNAVEAFDGVMLNVEAESFSIRQPNGGVEFIRRQ